MSVREAAMGDDRGEVRAWVAAQLDWEHRLSELVETADSADDDRAEPVAEEAPAARWASMRKARSPKRVGTLTL